jgi:hypothetical protein
MSDKPKSIASSFVGDTVRDRRHCALVCVSGGRQSGSEVPHSNGKTALLRSFVRVNEVTDK